MSYRRAWLLVDDLNSYFRAPVVATRLGGAGGGKADLTPLGRSLIRAYRAMEKDAERVLRRRSAGLVSQLRANPGRPRSARRGAPDPFKAGT
jgi:molybdate transport system regulatory protein